MGMVRFDQIARECRETFKGSFEGKPIVGLEHIEPYDMLLKNYDVDVETTFTKSFKKGQILFGRRRAYQHKACVATCDGICSGDITVIEPIEDAVYPDLLPFIIQNDDFFEHAIKGSNGALSPRVKWEHMANFEVDLPSIYEQKVLADKLWAAYEVKQSYLKMIDATDEILRSHYNELVGDTQTNVHDWPIKKLSELANYTIGLTYKPDDVKDDGTIVLRSGNIKNSSIDLDDIVRVNTNIKDSLYVKAGDILMCSRNGSAALVGKVAQIKQIKEPMTFGAFMTIISSPHTDYLFLFFESEDFRKQISGGKSSTMNQITQYMLDDIVVPFADEESRVRLSRILQQADKSKAELRKSVDAIDKVIKSLINENL